VAGAWSALVVSMCPGYLPLQGALLVAYLFSDNVWAAASGPWWRGLWRPALLAGCFAAGYFTLQYGLLSGSVPEAAVASRIQPLEVVPDGRWLTACCVLATLAAVAWFVRSKSMAAHIFVLLGTAACALQVAPARGADHHSYLVFFAVFVVLLCGQGIVNAGWNGTNHAAAGQTA
jgi:hypothetical protein